MSRVVRTPMRSTEVNIHPSAIVLCPTGRFRAKRRSADNSSCMKMHEIDRFWKFHSIVTFQPYYRVRRVCYLYSTIQASIYTAYELFLFNTNSELIYY